MTREEAVKYIQEISDQCCEAANILCTEYADKRCEALDMAIEALTHDAEPVRHAITGVKRWCYQGHIWCEFANEIGRCVKTACVKPQLTWVASTEYKGGDTE